MVDAGAHTRDAQDGSQGPRGWRGFRTRWMRDLAIVLWSPFLLWLLAGLVGLLPWPEGPSRLYGEGLGMLLTGVAVSLLAQHRWLGPALSVAWGVAGGAFLWHTHGHWVLMSSGQCLLAGDRGAAVFFLGMSVLGAAVGWHLGPIAPARRRESAGPTRPDHADPPPPARRRRRR